MSSFIPEGYRTLTGYPVVQNAAAMIVFLKVVFDAEEKFRAVGGAGGIHAEMRIGDCMLMVGGGGPDLKWSGHSRPMAFHISVPDVDATFERAVKAGAIATTPPTDQPWGERTANIEDPFGNRWYIGTRIGATYFFEGLPTLQPYLHPVHAEPEIDFIRRAFNAEEIGRHTSPEGKILHTTLKIGDATLEMSEADGPYQPMPSTFYLYVQDVDAAYNKAIATGATSITAPADQSYGDRSAGVTDPFSNSWYMATHLPKQQITA
jgi:PhnB protein